MDDLLLLIVCSPSGAGKTTLTRRLLSEMPELTFSVSHTTRRARANEVHGKDYHFISRDAFEDMVARGDFAEWAEVHGNFYGTSSAEIARARTEGRRGVVFDIDYQGARQIKAKFKEAVGVFILPPSLEELERRLRGRASDEEEVIKRRFAKALAEIEQYPLLDYLIVNDDIHRAGGDLLSVVKAELCKKWRVAPMAELLLRSKG